MCRLLVAVVACGTLCERFAENAVALLWSMTATGDALVALIP